MDSLHKKLNKQFYTAEEVTNILGLDNKDVQEYIKSGKLRTVKLDGKSIRINREDLLAFVKSVTLDKQAEDVVDIEVPEKKSTFQKITNAPFEILFALMFTPMYTKTPLYVSIPVGFLQAVMVLYIMLILFNTDQVTTGMRVQLSGGGILGALLAVGLVQGLLVFIDNFFLPILIFLLGFYAYITITKKWTRRLE